MNAAAENFSSDLMRQSLRVARWSGLTDLALGLVIVLLRFQEGRLASALIWWAVLAVIVIGRMMLARTLLSYEGRREIEHGPAVYTLFATLESWVWALGLLAVPVAAPAGAALQVAVTVLMVVSAAFVFNLRLRTWSLYVMPIVLAQGVFLMRHAALAVPTVLATWVISLVMATVLAWGVRRSLRALLLLRDQAQQSLLKAEQSAADVMHSREQLRLALEAFDVGVSDTLYESGRRFYSSRYAEILGFRDREAFLATHRFSAALHPEDRRRVLDARKAHRQGGRPFREEFRMRRADQSYIWVMGRGASVRDESGQSTRFVLSITDITERREAELAQAESARQYRALLNASPSLIWTCDASGRLTFVSERACRLMYGYASRDVVGRHVMEFNAPGLSRRQFLRQVRPALQGLPVFDAELQHFSAKGEVVNVTISALPTRDENGRIESVIGVATNITALKLRESELNVALRNQQALFDSAGEGIAFVKAGHINSANGALAKMLGVSRDWLQGRAVPEILAASEVWDGIVNATVDAGQVTEAAIHEVTLRVPDGTDTEEGGDRIVWCQLTSRLIQDSDSARGQGHSMILVLTDITALKRREELAWYQANHDELTGLPNRRQLMEHSRRLLSVAMRQKRLSAVMVLDLDGFKEVNDVLGHAHGDALLRRVAGKLSAVLREYDMVARTGGDEFVALLPDIDSTAVAVVVAEKMIAAATENLEHPGGVLRIHASVGVALFPADGHEFDALVQRADAAMYAAKAGGKNQLRLASELGVVDG